MLAELRKPANQWSENAALRVLEKSGYIKYEELGENIEIPVDYRANPDTAVLADDQDESMLVSQDIITTAVFDIAQMNVPVVWTQAEEIKNSSTNQKVALVKSKIENALASHDNQIETNIFTTSTAGGVEINGLSDLVHTATTGSPGGINSAVETWWANKADTFVDGSDIEAGMTEIFNSTSKGSGSNNQPTLLLSGSDSHALFESQLQTLQQFTSSEEADAGYKVLMFHGAKYIFSHKGGANIYFLNPKNYQLVVAKNAFRLKGDVYDIPGQNAFYSLLYSALQFCVSNRSRLGVLSQA